MAKKKATKKKVTKKKAEKSEKSKSEVLTKKTAKSIGKKTVSKTKKLQDAPIEQYFILCNGQPIKNVKELADIIEDLRDEVFNHHVNMDKNDFAKWISDVFNEIDLAEQLADVKDKKNMQLILYKHIVHKLT